MTETSRRTSPVEPGHPSMVRVVVEHALKPGSAWRYEQWLAKIIPMAASFGGHRGVHVMRPPTGMDVYTVTVSFDSLGEAEAWMRSRVRQELVTELEPLLDHPEKLDTVTGLEFWFMPPTATQKRVRPYKQFLLTLSVIYPLTMLVPWGLHPIIAMLPFLQAWPVEHLVGVGIVVALITWVIMPRYTKLVSAWLFR